MTGPRRMPVPAGRPWRPHQLLGAGLVLLACLGSSTGPRSTQQSRAPRPAEQGPVRESRVKAAFIYQFLRFTSWPAASFRRPDSPLVLTVFGPGPLDADLKRLSGRKVHGRRILVRRTQDPKGIDGSHALVILAKSSATRARVLRRVGKRSVLTISDGKAFVQVGGLIAFETIKRRVRFHLNLQGVRKAALKIHPKLLKLATSVHGRKAR